MDNPQKYDVWSEKPPWCQPWTILLTGFTIIAVSWLLFHRWWLSIPVATLVGLWWWYFLLVYPRLVQQAIAMDQENIN